MNFYSLFSGIYQLKLSFEEDYTSIFALTNGKEWVLLDAGFCPEDGRTVHTILSEKGLAPSVLLCSHRHRDHDGGLAFLAEAFPQATIAAACPTFTLAGRRSRVVKDGEVLLGRFQVMILPGHTADTLGVWDLMTGVLLSTDCLQCFGGGKYGTNIEFPTAYRCTLERLEALRPTAIVASHAYTPLGDAAYGEEEVSDYITACRIALDDLANTVRRFPNDTPEELADRYNNTTHRPPVSPWVMSRFLSDPSF